jgi:hypothetical protein
MRENEFSPIGDSVGVENPYLYGGSSDGGYPACGDPSSFKCAWDNVVIDCSSLNKFYISKNSVWFLTLVVRAHVGRVMRETKAELVPGGDKLGKVVFGDAQSSVEEGNGSFVEIIGLPDAFELHDVGMLMTWVSMQALQLPQNPVPNVGDLGNRITKIVGNSTCADFIKNLINKAAELTGNPAASNNALDLFNSIPQRSFLVGGAGASTLLQTPYAPCRWARSCRRV